MCIITPVLILPLLFPALEAADVASKYSMVYVGCFGTFMLDSDYDNYTTVFNSSDWSVVIETCKKDIKDYVVVVEPAFTSSREVYEYFCLHELFDQSTVRKDLTCELCYFTPTDIPRYCGGNGTMSVYKISNEPTTGQSMTITNNIITSRQRQFVPLYIAVVLLLFVVIIVDTFSYRRCRNDATEPNLVGDEKQGTP